jgi:hypothetical protein
MSIKDTEERITFPAVLSYDFYFTVVDFNDVVYSDLQNEAVINVNPQFNQPIALASLNIFSNNLNLGIEKSFYTNPKCPKI